MLKFNFLTFQTLTPLLPFRNTQERINNAPSWHKDVCAERASALHFHIVMKNLSKRLGFIYEKTKSL